MLIQADPIPVLNPATGDELGEIRESTSDDVDAAVDAARAAFPAWAGTPAHERAEILRRASALLAAHRDELAGLLCRENGKPLAQAVDEVGSAERLLRAYAEEALRLYGRTVPGDSQPGLEQDLILLRYEPRGVLGAIIAFNSPMDLFGHKVGPALATGNTVVLKPAEEAPLTVIRAAELLHEAGVPAGALRILTGIGETVGAMLAAHPGIDVVSLTGSTTAGISVARSAAERLSPVMLELGGNDPMIVFGDADLDALVEQAVWGRTLANGQICCANKRLIVHRSVIADVADALVRRLGAMPVGDPSLPGTEIGPLITDEAAARAADQVRRTLEQGGEAILGGERGEGSFFPPTVIANVPPAADIARDMEVFAPVLPLIAFEDRADAVRIANATRYGLNASVFTRDLDTAMYAAHHIQAGTVSVNATGLYRPDAIPYGGYKMSGYGREGLSVSVRELCEIKTIALRGVLPREAPGHPR